MIEVLGKTFYTLEEYLKWLKEEWYSFEIKLYTLEDYLAMGEFVWFEKNLQD
jgi:hypothetical protein